MLTLKVRVVNPNIEAKKLIKVEFSGKSTKPEFSELIQAKNLTKLNIRKAD